MPQKVLAVDDERNVVRIIQVILSREGYQVVTAADGVEALQQVAAEKPDLVLLDVNMPHMDGFEVLRRLKADPETAEIPVLMLTAKARDADLFHGREMGAEQYLTKPFSPTELVTFVRRVLDGQENSGGE